MKSRDEFTSTFSAELTGLLVSAFAVQQRGSLDERGRYVLQAIDSVSLLLARMHDYVAETQPEPKPLPFSVEDAAEQLIQRCDKVAPDVRERVVGMLRSAFSPPKRITETVHKNGKVTA